jgi:short-subunit dehydrogenase
MPWSPALPPGLAPPLQNAFINTFSQLLQSEVDGTGVQVQALCPGVAKTEFHERVGIDANRYPAAIVMKPEDVVQASLTGLKLGEVICVPALEDPDVLTQIQESQKRFFEQSRTGSLATRYKI